MQEYIPTQEELNEASRLVEDIEENKIPSNEQQIELEEIIQEINHLDNLNLVIDD